jgi:hypothetical protein
MLNFDRKKAFKAEQTNKKNSIQFSRFFHRLNASECARNFRAKRRKNILRLLLSKEIKRIFQ